MEGVPPVDVRPCSGSDDSQAMVSARSAAAVQYTKCSAVDNLRGFLSTVGGRISSALDDVGCLCMDDEDSRRRRRQDQKLVSVSARDAEDPPLFPGGQGPPTLREDCAGQRRAELVEELAQLCEVEQDGSVRQEDMVGMVKQLVRLHAESDESGKDSEIRASEAAVLAKLPRVEKTVPYRLFCDSILVALDELVDSKPTQEVLLEQLIAVTSLVTSVDEKVTASACKNNTPIKKPASELQKPQKPASEFGNLSGLSAASAPFRWVRHELSAIPERGESTLSYEAFKELVPDPLPSQEPGTGTGGYTGMRAACVK